MTPMTLLSPWHLLALLAVPLLWWLALPARPRVVTWTPHLAQWRAALASLRRRPPRLPRWRFVLLALAAVAAALAFARPVVRGRAGPTRLVVVLDGSASMAAHSHGAARAPDGALGNEGPARSPDGGSGKEGPARSPDGASGKEGAVRVAEGASGNVRTGAAATPGPRSGDAAAAAAADAAGAESAFVRAVERVRTTSSALPPHVDVTLLRAGGPLLRRHGASARAVHDVGGPAGPLDADLVALAAAAARVDGTAVWTLTDGQGQTELPSEGALTVLPTAGPNAAVVAARLVDRWPLRELELAVDVVAYASGASGAPDVRVELTILGAVDAVPERTLALARGAVHHEAFVLQRTAAGGELRVAVRLRGDVLAADDVWVVRLPPLPAPRIAVLTDGEIDTFAATAAKTLAAEVSGTVVAAGAGDEVGFLLVDGGRVAIEPGRVRALTFGCQLAGAGAGSGAGTGAPAELTVWRAPGGLDWHRATGLTAGLDLSELEVHQAWAGCLPGGEPFLWANEAEGMRPLAVVAGDDALASIHFAFRLQDSNLPLLPAFPQLLRRAFVRAHGAGAAPRVVSTPPAAGEQDLTRAATGPDRPLPEFGTPDIELWPWCLLAGLCALALRAFVR